MKEFLEVNGAEVANMLEAIDKLVWAKQDACYYIDYIPHNPESPIGFRSMLLNVLGNIVCFVPLGFLVPSVINFKNKFLAVVIVAFSSVLMVEVIQLVTKIGSFDVDDILLNVSGAMLGYGIYVIAKKFWNIKNNNKNKS